MEGGLTEKEFEGGKKLHSYFFMHTERPEEQLIITCHTTNIKDLFGNQYFITKDF